MANRVAMRVTLPDCEIEILHVSGYNVHLFASQRCHSTDTFTNIFCIMKHPGV